MENTSSANTNVFNKPALVTALNDSYVGKDIYTHGRNVAPYSVNGDEGTLGNEQSNSFCVVIPRTFIGAIDLNDDRQLVFSSDGTTSEIGIVDTNACTYTSVLTSECLGFRTDKVMHGVAKKLFNGDIVTTFGQKGEPLYRLNLSEIPYKYTIKDDACETKEHTKEVDCEEMLLFRKIKYPCFNIEKGLTGNLQNGTYNVTIAYVVDNEVFSDYFRPSQKIQIFEQVDGTSSINVHIDNLDRNFDKYQLVLIGTVKGVKTAKVIGEYPTFQSTVQISDFLTSTQITIPLEQLVLRKKAWKSAGIITSNSNYLLLSDLTKRPELNYQPQAMKIKAEYVVKQVPANYYENAPQDINYYGDENYDFYIQWLYNDGEESKLSHIPGRKATPDDRTLAVGTDAYELDENSALVMQKWQVENTAGFPVPTNAPFSNNERIAYKGQLGYFESTELYPDNRELFGDDACTPIRYHKFPDEEKVSRYEVINGIRYLNIKGVQFSNIEYPKDKDGKRVPGIIGYQILRSERKGGNKTVISTGIMTNVRKYYDRQNEQEIMFSNYPYNDLSPDAFISSTQTTFNGSKEKNFNAIDGYYQNRFNFYSPHSLYNLKYKHGSEVKIHAEEVADVTGSFHEVYGHPTSKLLSAFAFWAAAAIGSLEAVVELMGATSRETTITSTNEISALGITAGTAEFTSTSHTNKPKSLLAIAGTKVTDLITDIGAAIASLNPFSFGNILRVIKDVVELLAAAGVTTVLFTMTAMKNAQNILDILHNFLPFNQYAYQYNSHGFFNKSIPIKSGNKRRKAVHQPQYLSSNLHTINGEIFNNFGKQESVFFDLNKNIDLPTTKDDTRRTISGFGSCGEPNKQVKSTAVAYYAATKIPNPNQYGQLGTSTKVLASSCINYVGSENLYTSPETFGGDAIIAKQSIITKHPFFRQNMAVEQGNNLPSNLPPGAELNYNLYRNIGYPRYWMDTTKYDYSSLLSKKVINYSSFSRTVTSKHNLDCKGNDKENVFSVDDAYFYLYNNGVLEFYAECDYNISFREDTEIPHYSDKNTNLIEIMKSTNLSREEQFKLDKSFSDIYVNEVYGEQIPSTFNSLKDNTAYPNAIIYSLPSFNLQTFDNWQYFLPSNFFSFRESDFGIVTGIHKLDQDRLIFLFSKSSPFVSMGRDFLELEQSGRKITVGDGGMFAQDPREILPTDNNYGACQSKEAFSANQYGYYFPSEKQGRIFNFTNQLTAITEAGIAPWASTYMPIQLYGAFPSFKKENENPIHDVGYLTVFDSDYGIMYVTKRDFLPKDEFKADITYNSSTNKFYYKDVEVSLRSEYFEDISWTLSFDCGKKAFVGWHDWHPDWVIQGDTHFITVKDNAFWKHNEVCDSYCNFYGKDYPFELEFVSSDGQQVLVTRSAEWVANAYTYKNKCRDRFHLLDETFDKMIVHNTEQSSPLLTLVKHPQSPAERLQYPKFNGVGYDVLFSKEENKFRVNQFWDAIKDRGEFDNNEFHIFVTDGSGYRRTFNGQAIDVNKPEQQRKKFRQQLTKVWLSKEVSKNHKFIVKLFNLKKYQSPR